MLQGLQSVLGALGGMMAAPDADVQFLTTLQHAIVAKIKQGTQQAVSNQPGQGQPPGAGGPPGAPSQIGPGGGAGMSGFGAVVPPGGMDQSPQPGMGAPGPTGIGAPNPDELRRTLGATGQAA